MKNWTLLEINYDKDIYDVHIIDNLTVASGAYAILGISDDRKSNGNVKVDYVFRSYVSLEDEMGDHIQLLDADGILRDEVGYYDPNFPSTGTAHAGKSLQLRSIDLNNNVGDNWCRAGTVWSGSAGDMGTPGQANVCPKEIVSPIVITEIMMDPAVVFDGKGEWIGTSFDACVRIECALVFNVQFGTQQYLKPIIVLLCTVHRDLQYRIRTG